MWDEAKRLRCEWYNDYEKGVTKPPIVVSDLEVVELNFRGMDYVHTLLLYCGLRLFLSAELKIEILEQRIIVTVNDCHSMKGALNRTLFLRHFNSAQG